MEKTGVASDIPGVSPRLVFWTISLDLHFSQREIGRDSRFEAYNVVLRCKSTIFIKS